MPLPTDPQILKTSEDLVAQLQAIFGQHPGFRPAHARGLLVSGTFVPTPEAAALSRAQHFNEPSTPVTVRFSSSTGIPEIPDTDPNAQPRGLGLRFNLGGRKHTDIIAHSTPFFPVRTGADFLEFLRALATSAPGAPSPTPVEKFIGAHPETLAFVQAPKPPPASLAKDSYFGVTAFKLINAEGKTSYVRWQLLPDAGVETLSADDIKDKSPSFLYDEIKERVTSSGASFKLVAQVAEEGDNVNDATVHWPESRQLVTLGSFKLDAVVPDNDKEQKYIIFDPIPRVDGVEASDDPLLELRAAVYLISGRQRRAAP